MFTERRYSFMPTRAQVRFATREEGVSFNEHPDKIHAQFYVHYDGYPSGLGIDIARSIMCSPFKIEGWEIEHVQDLHDDLNYIYYIWSNYDKTTWMSVFRVGRNCETFVDYWEECIFVGEPKQFIEKYKLNTNEEG